MGVPNDVKRNMRPHQGFAESLVLAERVTKRHPPAHLPVDLRLPHAQIHPQVLLLPGAGILVKFPEHRDVEQPALPGIEQSDLGHGSCIFVVCFMFFEKSIHLLNRSQCRRIVLQTVIIHLHHRTCTIGDHLGDSKLHLH